MTTLVATARTATPPEEEHLSILHLVDVRPSAGEGAQAVFSTGSGGRLSVPIQAGLMPHIIAAREAPARRSFWDIVLGVPQECSFIGVVIEQGMDGVFAFLLMPTDAMPLWLSTAPADAVLMGLQWRLPFYLRESL